MRACCLSDLNRAANALQMNTHDIPHYQHTAQGGGNAPKRTHYKSAVPPFITKMSQRLHVFCGNHSRRRRER